MQGLTEGPTREAQQHHASSAQVAQQAANPRPEIPADVKPGGLLDASSSAEDSTTACQVHVQELAEYYAVLCAACSVTAGDHALMSSSLELLSRVVSALWGKNEVPKLSTSLSCML